jgi:hypothetical protein
VLGFVQQRYVGMALDAEGRSHLEETEALLREGLGEAEVQRLRRRAGRSISGR